MPDQTPRMTTLFPSLASSILIAIALVPLGIGCAPQEVGGLEISESGALEGTNGLKAKNGLRAVNGLNLSTSLKQSNGLLMSTDDGRVAMSYLVRCALPAGHTMTKLDGAGNRYTFPGSIGLAPEWENGACGIACQEWISACMLSLVNTKGDHIPLWMVAEHNAIGYGRSTTYPKQEGAFFGNLFLPVPQAFYCTGRDFYRDPAPGRIGSDQIDPPYSDPYGNPGTCQVHCRASEAPNQYDGYRSCSTWNRVITVWR
jgi:hypothetical protein